MRTLPENKRLFADGWGMPEAELADFYDRVVDPSALATQEPLEIQWQPWGHPSAGIVLRQGTYGAPMDGLPGSLGLGRLWDVRPQAERDRARLSKRCLLMGAWADEGFSKRRPIAFRLAAEGISTLVHETPFHGSRRIHPQGSPVRSVHEHAWLTRLSVLEGVRLFRGLFDDAEQWAVAGFSMGSSHAGAILALAERPAAGALFSVAYSPAIPFVQGELRNYVAWSSVGGRRSAAPRLSDLLERITLLPLPKPLAPDRLLIVGARNDTFVPAWSVAALADHWPEARLQWRSGGHGSLFLFERGFMARSIASLF